MNGTPDKPSVAAIVDVNIPGPRIGFVANALLAGAEMRLLRWQRP